MNSLPLNHLSSLEMNFFNVWLLMAKQAMEINDLSIEFWLFRPTGALIGIWTMIIYSSLNPQLWNPVYMCKHA